MSLPSHDRALAITFGAAERRLGSLDGAAAKGPLENSDFLENSDSVEVRLEFNSHPSLCWRGRSVLKTCGDSQRLATQAAQRLWLLSKFG